jgi:hypothetical protein
MKSSDLPEIVELNDFGGDYDEYIDHIYSIFYEDVVDKKLYFRGEELKLKWNPIFQEKAYTFYHITHQGEDEANRTPDLRRCERMSWLRPTVTNCDKWNLKVFEQKRGSKVRLCIWLEMIDEFDYFVIIDVRSNYKLLWTAFVAEYPHQIRAKQREYEEWLKRKK